ncbi:GlxA family transcriptional regulator [Rhodococcus jostii]|uniref:Transcriptional regulator GlxA family, contains an amidase domain and an AraC-type DNA-binding HTH domain n=1 Tax=Rhodococcus jostii TaxID=132919 RepID=A0A1H5JHS5_RHOJO|nr:helix-turn-helix domain-containing protein [Rhodococcus jostii]SEE51984.1 Transcriptional regulator GlxA family, contains an amidase domain and an AraC-type DNA-binding HTH domain [Rhodococcus jostii]
MSDSGDRSRLVRPHRVVVFVRDGVLPIEFGIVHRLFGEARSRDGEPLYEVLTCALTPGAVRTDTDVTISVEHGPALLGTADTVVVPASDQDYDPPEDGCLPRPLADAFAHIRPGTRMASICTGSFVLAAAGLLENRRATTHWKSADAFRRLYPHVRLDPGVLYTHDGAVLTAAGVASGIDLCLYMIRVDHGASVANEVARGTVVPPHRSGGQAQFITEPVPEAAGASTAQARARALTRLDQPLSLREMAAWESMSVRTFTRRFRAETGMSPTQWILEQRIIRARELLENTDLPVDDVAWAAGFGTATSLRQHLSRTVGVSPTAYRATFR